MNWSKTMCGVLTEAHSRSREAQDVLCVALTKPSFPYSRRDGWAAGTLGSVGEFTLMSAANEPGE